MPAGLGAGLAGVGAPGYSPVGVARRRLRGPSMNELSTTSALSAQAAEALHQLLQALWQFGGNALVAWMPSRHGIEVLTVPKIRLYNTPGLPRRVFAGDRLMGRQTFNEVAASLGIEPVEVRFDYPIGGGADSLSTEVIEQIFEVFAVVKTNQRAVALIDIVGFSRCSPEQQASQLATLEFALNIAAQAAREQGIDVADSRSTTGDGFYVWNRNKGLIADINLFVLISLFLTYYAVLRRRVTVAAAVPTLRTVLGVGSHYTYHQPGPTAAQRIEYIVGDVTIHLARLIERARADQVLVSDFRRAEDQSGETLSAAAFMDQVSARLAAIEGLTVLGHHLDRFSIYLTGPRQPDGSFGRQRFRIVDKHGFEHLAYNGKLNIFLKGGDSFYCGLQHADLVTAAAKGGAGAGS
jgi:hypothetical protein